jgi:hypothetical protein
MPSRPERRKHARSKQKLGTVSHHAQRRVNQRVLEIMARGRGADQPNSPAGRMAHSGQARPPEIAGAAAGARIHN